MRKVSGQHHKKEEASLNLMEYARIIWRKKLHILIPIAAAAVVAIVGSRFLTPMYQVSTVIRIEDKQFFTREVARYVQTNDRRSLHDAEALAKLRADIESTSFLNQLIEQLGLDTNPQASRRLAERLARSGSELSAKELIERRLRSYLIKRIVTSRSGPGMFEIAFTDYNPEICYIVAGALADLYIQRERDSQMKNLKEASQFNDEQLALYKERLDQSERALQRFKQANSGSQMVTNPVNSANVRIAETLAMRISDEVSSGTDVVARIRRNILTFSNSIPSTRKVWEDMELNKLIGSLIARRQTQTLIELSGTMGRSQEVVDSQSDIAGIEMDIQHYLSSFVMQSYPDFRQDHQPLVAEYFFQNVVLESLKEQQKKLQGYINSFKSQLALTPQRERELASLTEEVEANRTLYNAFLGAKTSAQITEAVQSTDLGTTIEVVEQATKPLGPVKPNKTKILIFAILFGGAIGTGVLLLSEMTDTSFRSVEEVESVLGIKVVGTIPAFDSNVTWKKENSKTRMSVMAAIALAAVFISIMGFYYYGKSSEKEMLYMTRTEIIQK
ncbi:MAG: GNVR domain-containing protein [Candidatus Latescibacterota bacterium]